MPSNFPILNLSASARKNSPGSPHSNLMRFLEETFVAAGEGYRSVSWNLGGEIYLFLRAEGENGAEIDEAVAGGTDKHPRIQLFLQISDRPANVSRVSVPVNECSLVRSLDQIDLLHGEQTAFPVDLEEDRVALGEFGHPIR